MRTRTAESMLLYHIFCMIAGVLVMSDAQKHPLLESTSSGEVWLLVANDCHCDDDDDDDEDETAHRCSDGSMLRSKTRFCVWCRYFGWVLVYTFLCKGAFKIFYINA